MQKRILIGLGTGRCGTTSLTNVLNKQEGCQITHESSSIRVRMTWFLQEKAGDLAIKEMESREGPISGDVAFYYLPYVEWIAAKRPDTTFICLKRDRAETVESYLRKTQRRDHWSGFCVLADPWDRLYPQFNTYDKREAIGMYWDVYYREVERLERSGVRIKTFDISCLNSEEGVKKILEFAGVGSPSVVVGMRSNKGR